MDITIHEVLSGGRMKELHKATGGAWGGTYVDDKFFDIIKEIVGEKNFESFKKEDLAGYNDLCKDLEVKKREINTESTKISFIIPNLLAKKIPKDYDPEKLEYKKGKLELKMPIIKKWFSEICNSIVSHLKELLEEQEKKQRNIDSILMVGGFSESSFLQETMKKAFPNKHIIVPNEAGLAVLRGAVLFGHDPQIVASRVAKVTYGVNTLSKIQDGKDVSANRITDIKGVKYEKDVFSKHVTKGDDLILDEVQEQKTYYPIFPDQKSVQFSVYTSTEKDPRYVDGCKKLGSFDVKIPDTTEGTDRKVVVRFIFGGTEIKVEGVDEKTNEVTECKFEWSENAEEECFGMAVEMDEK